MKDPVFLVVDDDGMVRDILVQYLNSFGYSQVLQAKDGKAAIKILQTSKVQIDIVISDWEMPKVDGLTLLRSIRMNPAQASMKFLMVSSQSSHERMKISRAAKSHVDAYVVKPFRAHILKEKIDALLNENKSENETESDNEDSKDYGKVRIKNQRQTEAGKVIGVVDLPPLEYDIQQMNVNLILSLAKSYKKVKWFEKAIKLCKDASLVFPDNADVLYHLADALFLSGDIKSAKDILKTVIKIEAYHIEAHQLIDEIRQKSVAP